MSNRSRRHVRVALCLLSAGAAFMLSTAGHAAGVSGTIVNQSTWTNGPVALTPPGNGTGIGRAMVGIWDSAGDVAGAPAQSSVLAGPAGLPFAAGTSWGYNLAAVPSGSYKLAAWVDGDADGAFDTGEPRSGIASVTMGTNNVTVTSQTVIDDTDTDGMADWWETRWFGNMATGSGDSDSDGLSNAQEYQAVVQYALTGLAPNDWDSDNDTMSDGWEYGYYANGTGLNPTIMDAGTAGLTAGGAVNGGDADGDGLLNIQEYRGIDGEPPQEDTDGNNIAESNSDDSGDVLNPINVDTDSDYLLDSFEAAWCDKANGIDPKTAGTRTADQDVDGLTHYREQCLHASLRQGGTYDIWTSGPGAGALSTFPTTDANGVKKFAFPGLAFGAVNPTIVADLARFRLAAWTDPSSGYYSDSKVNYAFGSDTQHGGDTDRDALPDGWEVEFALDPRSSVGANGYSGDPDGDYVINYQEYNGQDGNRGATNPRINGTGDETNPNRHNWRPDSTGPGPGDQRPAVAATYWDTTYDYPSTGTLGAALPTASRGTDPGADTDDDGLTDRYEIQAEYLLGITGGLSPIHSMHPFVRRGALVTNAVGLPFPDPEGGTAYAGNGYRPRLHTRNWTIECYVKLLGTNCSGFLLNCPGPYADITNVAWRLELSNNIPRVGFHTLAYWQEVGWSITPTYYAVSGLALPTNRWIHLAATWDASENDLALYVDGVFLQEQRVYEESLSGYLYDSVASPTICSSRDGSFANKVYIDEVRVWDYARSSTEIEQYRTQLVNPGLTTNLLAYFRFDDGGVLAQDFARPAQNGLTGAAGANYTFGDLGYALTNNAFSFTNDAAPLRGVAANGADDTDGDGMPDAWEMVNHLNPNSALANHGATGDPDGDGLQNLYEFWADTSPNAADTDGDSRLDANEDRDGDGSVNLAEQTLGSRPDMADTDDDGLTDGEEQVAGTVLTEATDPQVTRSVALGGSTQDYLEVPNALEQRLTDWTLEAWVRPDTNAAAGAGAIIRRVTETRGGTNAMNFVLGLENNGGVLRPYAGYGWFTKTNTYARYTVYGASLGAASQWIHLAATYDSLNARLTFYTNGNVSGTPINNAYIAPPINGKGGETYLRIGEDMKGNIDEVRIWSRVRMAAEIHDNYDDTVATNSTGLVHYFRFDDGQATNGTIAFSAYHAVHGAQDYTKASDWSTEWSHAAALHGDAGFQNLGAMQLPPTLRVVIEPPDARNSGAQWQVDGGAYYDSGASVKTLAQGARILGFKTIANWATPAPLTVILTNDVTSVITNTYQQLAIAGVVTNNASWTNGPAAMSPPGNGAGTGRMLVGVWATNGVVSGQPVSYQALIGATALPLPLRQEYTFSLEPLNSATYRLIAWIDGNGNNGYDIGESRSAIVTVSVQSNRVSGASLLVTDDADFDAVPDWWEAHYFSDLDENAASDTDGDRLWLSSEYRAWLASSGSVSPTNKDANANGKSDYYEDSDGDGLANGDEQDRYGCNPGRADTDDDGYQDGREVDASLLSPAVTGRKLTSPVYSRSPLVQQAMVLNGAAYTVGDPVGSNFTYRYSLDTWTVEGWIKPTGAAETGVLMERVTTSARTNFSLGLSNNIPVLQFSAGGGTVYTAATNAAIPAGQWTHLAGVWAPASDSLSLYVNGLPYLSRSVFEGCATGGGTVRIGRGLNGLLDELRVWRVARTATEIETSWDAFGPRSAVGSAADIVFIIDVSGSMGSAIAKVKANITDFVNNLSSRYINAQIGGVRFSDTLEGGGGSDTPPDGYGFTTSGETFLSAWLTPLELQGGGDFPEDDLGALTWALNGDNFSPSYRTGARKVFILVTDADDKALEDSGDTGATLRRADVIAALKGAGVTVHAVTRADRDVVNIANETGGQVFDIDTDDYSPIFDTIASSMETEPPMVAWYPFDDGGASAEDYVNRLDSDYYVTGVTFSADTADLEGEIDNDGDGIPDWWETFFFGVDGTLPNDDGDGDGLNNLYEYQNDTSPKATDTDGDSYADGAEDDDGDGVDALTEQTKGMDPRVADTDDDGLWDLAETGASFDGDTSVIPLRWRGLSFPGNAGSYMELPRDSRLGLATWTIEAWVRPASGWTGGGRIVERVVAPGVTNFVLGINSSRMPYAGYSGEILTGTGAVTNDGATWTHLAASYDSSAHVLRLYVNGIRHSTRVTGQNPRRTGVGPYVRRVGAEFQGEIDNLTIWSTAWADSSVTVKGRQEALAGTEDGLVAYWRFDDSTSDTNVTGVSALAAWQTGQVEDYAAGSARDWLNQWRNAGTLAGAAVFTNLMIPPGLAVTIEPAAARTAGGQFAVDGGTWQDSGMPRYDLAAGQHSVAFKPVDGWVMPNTVVAVLSNGVITALTGAYVKYGAIQMALSPEALIRTTGGARWAVDGGEMQSPGTVSAAPGIHRLSFNPLSGYREPTNETVVVTSGNTLSLARVYTTDIDTDGDGLPDSWELSWFGDLRQQADADYDQDGLTNLREYQVSTNLSQGASDSLINPMTWDTDGDRLPDGWEVIFGLSPTNAAGANGWGGDPDGDGLANGEEYFGLDGQMMYTIGGTGYFYHVNSDGAVPHVTGTGDETDPLNADTDDDGLSDSYEATNAFFCAGVGSSPVHSMSPFIQRSIRITDPAGIAIPNPTLVTNGYRADLLNRGWTLECYVKLMTTNMSGYLVNAMDRGGTRIAYRLALTNNMPSVSFHSQNGVFYEIQGLVLPTNRWIHLAGSWNYADNRLSLVVDGVSIQENTVFQEAASFQAAGMGAAVPIRIAQSPDGSFTNGLGLYLDEVRIWSDGLRARQIEAARRFLVNWYQMPQDDGLPSYRTNLVACYRFDDGGSSAEDFTKKRVWDLAGAWPAWYMVAGDMRYALPTNAFVFVTNTVSDRTIAANMHGVHPLGADDTTGNHLPDDWELMNNLGWLSVTAASQVVEAALDTDGDGLSNLYEFWGGTNPNAEDSDGDGILDIQEDSDGDLLLASREEVVGSLPNVRDTDDDGVSDGAEWTNDYNPVNAFNPALSRALSLASGAGASYMDIPAMLEQRLSSWTLEGWVRLTNVVSGTGYVVRRAVQKVGAEYASNYEMLITTNAAGFVAAAGYRQLDGTACWVSGVSVPSNTWTHLAASYSALDGELRFYTNGTLAARVTGLQGEPPKNGRVGEASLRVGDGLIGLVDDVRIWSVVRSATDIAGTYSSIISASYSAKTYVDIALPLGDMSFADEYVEYVYGRSNPTEKNSPLEALGAPDVGDNGEVGDKWVSLGWNGRIVLKFTDNPLIASGNATEDLWVFEMTTATPADRQELESYLVEISEDGLSWKNVGSGRGVVGFNIEAVARGDQAFQYVRITDMSLANNIEGVDIAAVAGVSSRRALTHYFRFDDGGTNMQDSVYAADWTNQWIHAGELMGTAKATDGGGAILPLPSLTVTLQPSSARDAGALWRISQGTSFSAWQRSGWTVTDLEPGNHNIEFWALEGWSAPATESISLAAGTNTAITRTYNALGAIRVTLGPQAALDQGAKWKISGAVGGQWLDSNTRMFLPTGTVTVTYLTPTNYWAPLADEQVLIVSSVQTNLARNFAPNTDTDNDGLDDTWEYNWFGAGNLAENGRGDPDGDGLTNYAEYVYSRSLNPASPDTDRDGLSDGWEIQYGLLALDATGVNGFSGDPDGDGLVNIEEYEGQDGERRNYIDGTGDETSPILADTDDDGMTDGAEVQNEYYGGYIGSSPVHSMSPFVPRAILVRNAAGLMLPDPLATAGGKRADLMTRDWTIECQIKLLATNCSGWLVNNMDPTGTNIAYRLLLTNNAPEVGFQTRGGTYYMVRGVALPTNRWIHLAGAWSHADNRLSLVVDGVNVLEQRVYQESSSYQASGIGSATNPVLLRSANNTFANALYADEIRIWSVGLSATEVDQNKQRLVNPLAAPAASNLLACFRFDDGGATFEDFGKRWRSALAGSTMTNYYGDPAYNLPTNGMAVVTNTPADRKVAAPAVGVDLFGADDTDGDGLADAWELVNHLDPRNAAGANGAAGDPDGDGLLNRYEYWAQVNPHASDTDHDGVLDVQEDYDGDGLMNLDEQASGTRPDNADTDDDGINDNLEWAQGNNGANPIDPPVSRAMLFAGTASDHLELPSSYAQRLSSWTVEGWVNAQTLGGSEGYLVRRAVQSLSGSTQAVNYVLGLRPGAGGFTAFAGFISVTNGEPMSVLASGGAIATGTWVHLSASFDNAARELILYTNGIQVASASGISAAPPLNGQAGDTFVRIGEQLGGQIDEVRVWSAVRSQAALRAGYDKTMDSGSASLVNYLRFDDGQATNASIAFGPFHQPYGAQDFVFGADWTNLWRHAATHRGTTRFVQPGAVAPPPILQVRLFPAEAVNFGAQWALDGGVWRDSGETAYNLAEGNHTISYKTLDGWTAPASESISLTNGAAPTLDRIYFENGRLVINLEPAAVRALDAKWAIDGGVWRNSGTVASNLSVGQHTLTFGIVTNWYAPPTQTISVAAGQLTTRTVVYTQKVTSIRVTITPAEAVAAGAQWRLGTSGGWQDSGVSTQVNAGNYTVTFSDITGWQTPANMAATVVSEQTTELSAGYFQMSVLGSAGTGTGAFSGPRGLAVRGNRLYVADTLNNRLQVYDIAAGTWSVVSGGGLNAPNGVEVDRNGRVWVADTGNDAVKMWNPADSTWTTIASGRGSGAGQFWRPLDVAVDSVGNLFVAEYYNDRIQRRSTAGVWSDFVTGGLTAGKVYHPCYLATHPLDTVFVVDRRLPTGTNLVQEFSAAGGYQRTVAYHYVTGSGQAPESGGITFGPQTNLYFCNTSSNTLHQIAVAGDGTITTVLDGSVLSAPSDVAVDAWGNIYVADTGHNRVILLYSSLADTDKDGIPDTAEAFYGTAVNDVDSDDDGYADGTEVLSGTDPRSAASKPANTTRVSVTSHSGSPITTGNPVITLAGSAAGNATVTNVTYANNRSDSGTCSGTTSWSCTTPLYSGDNTIKVIAFDTSGTRVTNVVTVRYSPLYPQLDEAVLRAGMAVQSVTMGDNFIPGTTNTLQWSILSYVPVISALRIELANGSNVTVNATRTGSTNGIWQIGDRTSKVYFYTCAWVVPQVPGNSRLRFLAAQQDGFAYMNANVPSGVDARSAGDGKRILRTIAAGGTNPGYPSEAVRTEPPYFETIEEAVLRAGGTMTTITVPTNLVAGSVATCRWDVLSYVPVRSRLYIDLPTLADFQAEGALTATAAGAWYIADRQASLYSFLYLWTVPTDPGACRLRIVNAQNDGYAWMNGNIPDGVVSNAISGGKEFTRTITP